MKLLQNLASQHKELFTDLQKKKPLTDSDELRSPDDKKFKGHTGIDDISTAFTKFKAKKIKPAFMFFNKFKDKLIKKNT